MKSESGITLTSLIVYVIAMLVVVGIVATLTGYFYNNLDNLSNRTDGSKEYTAFSSYFTNDINTKNNKIVLEESTEDKIVFSNGNQYTFLNGAIYMNKIQICKNVDYCAFGYNSDSKVTVAMNMGDKSYTNTYELNNTD